MRKKDVTDACWVISLGKLKNGGGRKALEKNDEFNLGHRIWRDDRIYNLNLSSG